MDRRSFVTSALLSVGFLLTAGGAASALPVTPPENIAPQTSDAQGPVENVWWRRRRWRRRHWRRW